MSWKKPYNEGNASDFYEISIDADTGETTNPSLKEKSLVTTIREWAEKKRGRKFLQVAKQNTAIKRMLQAKIKPSIIMEKYKKLEETEWGKKVGIDFMSVFNAIDKK